MVNLYIEIIFMLPQLIAAMFLYCGKNLYFSAQKEIVKILKM